MMKKLLTCGGRRYIVRQILEKERERDFPYVHMLPDFGGLTTGKFGEIQSYSERGQSRVGKMAPTHDFSCKDKIFFLDRPGDVVQFQWEEEILLSVPEENIVALLKVWEEKEKDVGA